MESDAGGTSVAPGLETGCIDKVMDLCQTSVESKLLSKIPTELPTVGRGYTSGIASNLPLSNVPTQTLRTGRTTRPTQKVKETYGLAQSLRKRSRRRAGTLANQNISPSQDQPDQLVRVLFPVPLPGLSSGPVLVPELTGSDHEEVLGTSLMPDAKVSGDWQGDWMPICPCKDVACQLVARFALRMRGPQSISEHLATT